MIKKYKTNKLNDSFSNIQIKSISFDNEDEIIVDMPKNIQRKHYKEILKLSIIKHLFSKYDKNTLLNIISKRIGQAVLWFALLVFGFMLMISVYLLVNNNQIQGQNLHNNIMFNNVMFWTTTMTFILIGLFTIDSFINFVYMFKKGNCLYQKIKKQLVYSVYSENEKPIEDKWPEIDSEEHKKDMNNFLKLMKQHDYDSAKKLADKHNWKIMVKQNELENHMSNVKKQMKQKSNNPLKQVG